MTDEIDPEAPPFGWSYRGRVLRGPHEGQATGILHNVGEKIPLGEEVEVIDDKRRPTGDWAVIIERWPSPYPADKFAKRRPGRKKKARSE